VAALERMHAALPGPFLAASESEFRYSVAAIASTCHHAKPRCYCEQALRESASEP
jgi:hypothetical protein